MYVCGSDLFTQYGPAKHWAHCKSMLHPPPPYSPVTATVGDLWCN